MSLNETEVEQEAIAFAKAQKKEIALRRTDVRLYPSDSNPVSVFMAGSPGAGKTESSQRLIEKLTQGGHSVLRIDSDELRSEFSSYTGKNSSLFQAATSIIADRMQDLAIERGQNYVFDGTLSNIERSRENTKRSLSHGRFVQIIYVYQDPIQAWKFVLARAERDGRVVPKEKFIEQYFCARENVQILKKEFGPQVRVDLVAKNIDGTDFRYKENVDIIDSYIPESYTKETLSALLESL